MFDDKKYIECPREEATHLYFAGNVHLSATDKQDVPWCDVDGEDIYFYAPGIGSGGYYTYWEQECAPEEGQRPLFLKERELEVGFEWSNYPRGMLAAEIAGVTIALVVFPTQRIRKYGDPDDPNAIKFDDDWTIRQIKDAAAEYARKIARGEL